LETNVHRKTIIHNRQNQNDHSKRQDLLKKNMYGNKQVREKGKVYPHFKIVEDSRVGVRHNISVIPGYSPSEVRSAYGLDNFTENGEGQLIAIVGAYNNPNIQADFKFFDAAFNIGTPNNLEIYSLGTQPDQGWALETCLDVQWSHAFAPGAKILLVQAATSGFEDTAAAINYAISRGADVISMSWGTTEFPEQSGYNKSFVGNNVVFVASSGDTGGIVNWPSSSQNVLAIGGTSLILNSNNTYSKEKGWTGSGGGQSQYEPLPPWQQTYGLTGKRHTPDISMIADPNTGVPIYNSSGFNGKRGWFKIGGTSLSAPAMAGLIATVNHARTNTGKQVLNYIDITNYLYGALGTTPDYSTAFNDITIGQAGMFNCNSGYDNVTGLGTPKNPSASVGFIADLVALP
jgi:subtilase family serine protease